MSRVFVRNIEIRWNRFPLHVTTCTSIMMPEKKAEDRERRFKITSQQAARVSEAATANTCEKQDHVDYGEDTVHTVLMEKERGSTCVDMCDLF